MFVFIYGNVDDDFSIVFQKRAADFLKEKILKSCKELKSCYQNPASEEDVKTKIIE